MNMLEDTQADTPAARMLEGRRQSERDLAYIQKQYGVAAVRGRVAYHDGVAYVIVGANDGHLKLRGIDSDREGFFHPTKLIEYPGVRPRALREFDVFFTGDDGARYVHSIHAESFERAWHIYRTTTLEGRSSKFAYGADEIGAPDVTQIIDRKTTEWREFADDAADPYAPRLKAQNTPRLGSPRL
jgi:hypothetical protein